MRFRLAALAALFALAVPATAQVVVDNGPFATGNAFGITSIALADDFTLAAPATFNAVRFWAVDNSGDAALLDAFSGTLSWFVHDDASGVPGSTILASGTTSGITLLDTGATIAGVLHIFQLDFSVPDTTLAAGTYWLRLKENAPAVPDDGSEVLWVQRGGQSGSLSQGALDEVNPSGWFIIPSDLSYELRFNAAPAAVPEPGTIALLATSVLPLGAIVLRRRRA